LRLSRRDLLTTSALSLGASLPLSGQIATAAAASNTSSLRPGESLELARYVERTTFDDLPDDVVEMTKRSLLDAIGVSLAASKLEPACRPFLEYASEFGGRAEASILGTGQRAPAVIAALANGSLAHAMDYEDAHEETRTHPNAAAVAAALPLAERSNASGRELITAIALGCDVVCRLARALVGEGAPPPGFYQPAIVGTFGAATAAAKLLKLNTQQILDTWALALCQNSCSGELQNTAESQLRAVREGPCARVGIESALLASRGVRGFDAPFEGTSGFFVMYAQGVQRASLLTDLGKRFAGRDISFKAWPSCRDTHVYVQASLELLDAHSIDVKQIASITTSVTEQNMIVCEPAALKRRPQNAIAGKFSLYYTLAAALLDRRIEFGSFSNSALRRPEALTLADKVAYRIDRDAVRRGDVLEVTMKDGRTLRHNVRAVYGSPANPLSREVLVTKFIDCGRQAAQPLERSALEEMAGRLLDLERHPVAEILRS